MALLKKLLNNLAFHSPAILTEEEGNKHPKELEVLISLGVLKQDTFPQERWCPSCGSESVPIQVVSKERAYTLCTTDEGAGRDYFDPQTLKQWRFDTPPFISLFLKALGIDATPTENIAGLLWDLGNHTLGGKSYHIFFARNINDELLKNKSSIIISSSPEVAVFYLGTINTSPPDSALLAPVLEIIKEVNTNGVVISPEVLNSYFTKELFTDDGGDLLLDEHIVLSHNRKVLLLHRKRGGGLEKEIEINPQASYLIAHCYQIRHYQPNVKTLKELADALTKNGNKRSISNRIKFIQDLCKKEGVKPILHKYIGEKWGLNQKLDCCKNHSLNHSLKSFTKLAD